MAALPELLWPLSCSLWRHARCTCGWRQVAEREKYACAEFRGLEPLERSTDRHVEVRHTSINASRHHEIPLPRRRRRSRRRHLLGIHSRGRSLALSRQDPAAALGDASRRVLQQCQISGIIPHRRLGLRSPRPALVSAAQRWCFAKQ